MIKNVSSLKITDINKILLNKIRDYVSIMGKFVSKEEIEERREILVEQLDVLVKNFDSSRKQRDDYEAIGERARENFKISAEIDKVVDIYNTSYLKLDSIINDEIGFLKFFTTNFESENPEEEHGLIYRGVNGNNYYQDIDKSITYSVIKVMDANKRLQGEDFNYPYELRKEDEAEVLRYYQIKDKLTMDMMDIFKDNLMRYYFLGKGEEFNKEVMRLFVYQSTLDIDDIKERMEKEKAKGHFYTEEEAIILDAIEKRDEFDKGVKKSVSKNDESYYSRYVDTVKNFQEISKEIDWSYIDEKVEKKNKGLK